MLKFVIFLIFTITYNNLLFAMEKPYHHLTNGTFRNPEGSPQRDNSFNWSFKIFNQEKKKLNMYIPDDHVISKNKVLENLKSNKDKDYIAWIGHATFIIKLGNTTIITDPVFEKNMGPLIFGPKRFVDPAIDLNEIPEVNLFLLTHNHYDHLSTRTIQRFPYKKAKVLAPLKLGKYFTRNGFKDVKEMDWYDTVELNDVKITSQAFLQSVNYYDFFDQKNFIPLLTVAGTVFAYFSIIILSYGEFSRHLKNKSELKKGNLRLILNLVVFSFMALFIVSGADALIKQDAQNLSRILTNPTDIIGKMNNLLVTILVLIFIIIASASTNLIANFIPSQYTLINFIPSSISLKGASYTIGFFGFFLGVFWLTFLSQIGILSIIDTLGAFFGPLFGLMICDYYFIKKNKLNNKDIYSLDKNGIYYYSGGWHLKADYSLILGFIFAASTIWNSNLMFLQSYSWIMGAFIAAIVYYLLAKD